MSPEESYRHLESKKSDGLVWLLRESRTPGMLTVSFTLFSNNIPGSQGNTRYALTKSGWICTSEMTEEIKESLRTMRSVNRACASKYINQLNRIITSKSLYEEYEHQTLKHRFSLEDRIIPTSEMQTTNETYVDYIIT